MRRVPVIMQIETVECGAAALSMILASYGRWESLDTMRIECGVSRDGMSAYDLIKAGERFGLKMEGLQLDIEDLHLLKEPCIMHVDFSHFIVFRGFIGSYAMANDPAKGFILMSRREFSKRFSGVVITCKRTPKFKKGGSAPSLLSFIGRRLNGAWEQVIFTFLTTILLAIVTISLPVASQAFADGILSGTNPEWGEPLIVTLTLLAIFQFAVNCIFALYNRKLSCRTQISASSSFIWHLLRLPLSFFSMRMPGELMMRAKSVGQIPVTLVKKIAPLAVNLAMLLLYGFFMYQYSPILSIIVLISTVIVIISVVAMSFIQMNLARKSSLDTGRYQTVTMSNIECIETIKAAGAEEGAFKRWARTYADAANSLIEINKFSEYLNLVPSFLMQFTSILVLISGCSLILDGVLTIGMLMAFQGFMNSFISPMSQIVGAVTALSGMCSDIERVEDVYRTDTDVNPASAEGHDMTSAKLKGEVELCNVTFGYSTIHEPFIRDFSCHIKPGKSIAFVGASGSGKSTLSKLISGLYRPWSGEIKYDGHNLSEINRSTFAGSVALISQSNSFFNGSLRENLKLWDESIEDFVMVMACHDAKIHNEITRRRGAYESPVETGGHNFSGGQRQRLEIASALIKEPTVIIMDEATSALDAATEAQVMQSVRDMGITLIVVAHRLSTIRDCDEIVVLEKGIVQERGTHQELMEKRGKYYNLVSDN